MAKRDVKRIKFDRGEKTAIFRLPSHKDQRAGPVRTPGIKPKKKRAGLFLKFLGGLVAFVCLVVGFAFVGLRSGYFAPALEGEAKAAISRAVPKDYRVETGDTKVSLAWPPSVLVEYADLVVRGEGANAAFFTAKKVAVGVNPIAMMSGQTVPDRVEITDGRLALPSPVEAGEQSQAMANFRISRLPEYRALLSSIIVKAFREAKLRDDGAMSIELDNVALSAAGKIFKLSQTEIEIENQSLVAVGEIGFENSVIPVSVRARGIGDDAVSASISMETVPLPIGQFRTMLSNAPEHIGPGRVHEPIPADITLSMVDYGEGDQTGSLTMHVNPVNFDMMLSSDDGIPVTSELNIAYDFAEDVIDIAPSAWTLGRSNGVVSARLRDPSPDQGAIATPGSAAEFELLINKGVIAASDAHEPSLPFAGRFRGYVNWKRGDISFDQMEVDSAGGFVTANGILSLNGETPLAIFEINSKDITVSAVKQIWPAPVARQAREWVLNNMAGGHVTSAYLKIAEPLRRRVEGSDVVLDGDTNVDISVAGVRFGVTGDIPPVRDAIGRVVYENKKTTITLQEGTVYLPTGRTASASNGTMTIAAPDQRELVMSNIRLNVSGEATAIGEIIQYDPINAGRYTDFKPNDLSGSVSADINLDIALNGQELGGPPPDWDVALKLKNVSLAKEIDGRKVSSINGSMTVTPERAQLDVKGNIDALPAEIAMVIPFPGSGVKAKQDIAFTLDDKSRRTFAPGLEQILTGSTRLTASKTANGMRIETDLKNAVLSLPWIGWSKGKGIGAPVSFTLVTKDKITEISDLKIDGGSFAARGSMIVDNGGLASATFSSVRLNRGDDFALKIRRDGSTYRVDVSGNALDARAIMRHIRNSLQKPGSGGGKDRVALSGKINTLLGFGGEILKSVNLGADLRGSGLEKLLIKGTGSGGMPFEVSVNGQGAGRKIRIDAFNAGEFMRFLDLYGQIDGGAAGLSLTAQADGALVGNLEIKDFNITNEPALAKLVSTKGQNNRSLRDAATRNLDTNSVPFTLAKTKLRLANGGLNISDGIVRGPLVGFALDGQVWDRNNQMRITGTFIPAYGLNSLFAEIPLIGLFLGGGRDKGLIGVTFLLQGEFGDPKVTINPLSLIAPGIFRQIFEFR